MSDLFAFGLGLATTNTRGALLDTWFPAPLFEPPAAVAALAAQLVPGESGAVPAADAARLAEVCAAAGLSEPVVSAYKQLGEAGRSLTGVRLATDEPITSTEAAYLKLHLLSHRLCLPNTVVLDGLFAHLPTVAWTSAGPIDPQELPAAQQAARLAGAPLTVHGLDKFPRMTDYVVPSGVRIADTSRVRLGAYLGEGTTVMPEGQVNFNAGALGPNMVEGRISQGVVLGANTDLGGGASTMGTLSGGGSITISLGEHCLVGANAGTGIPLGDRCTIEAGLYITAGTRVRLLTSDGRAGELVKARELAGQSDLLFIRHSATGEVQCRTNRSAIELNDALHSNN